MHTISADTAPPRPLSALHKLFTVALLLLGLAYMVVSYKGQFDPGYRGDIGIRSSESKYLVRGIDPYDVSAQRYGNIPTPRESQRIAAQNLQNEELLTPSGYPPWGLAATIFFVPPMPYHLNLHIFGILNCFALAYTCYLAYTLGKHWGHWPGLLLAASILGVFANATAMKLGQYGFILNAALCYSLRAHITGKELRSGLGMALAAIKPNYTFTHVVLLLARKQWLAFGVVCIVCAILSLVPWILTGVDPITMTLQMLRQSALVSMGDTSMLDLIRRVIPFSIATSTLALAAVAATAWAGWKYRLASPLVATSVAAVAGRICLYHRQYDNQMLIFPLLALGMIALNARKFWAWGMFAFFGITLWPPLLYWQYTEANIAIFSAAWVIGAIVICRNHSLLNPGVQTAVCSEIPSPEKQDLQSATAQ